MFGLWPKKKKKRPLAPETNSNVVHEPAEKQNTKQEEVTSIRNMNEIQKSSADKYYAIQNITQWKEVEKEITEKDTCCICLYEFFDDEENNNDTIVQLSRCGPHYYHRDCIIQCYVGPKDSDKLDHDGHLTCPVCSIIYGIRTGTMPKGSMTVTTLNKSLPSYADIKTIQICYSFPNGIQGPEHPSPGSRYTGTSRTCYLPDTQEGREVLRKLELAFDRRLSFMIGTSVTTGASNTVVWNGIHHKTNFHGGSSGFGYPDPTYLNRVTQELACVGIL